VESTFTKVRTPNQNKVRKSHSEEYAEGFMSVSSRGRDSSRSGSHVEGGEIMLYNPLQMQVHAHIQAHGNVAGGLQWNNFFFNDVQEDNMSSDIEDSDELPPEQPSLVRQGAYIAHVAPPALNNSGS